jgi:hypothetical protein
MSLVYLSAVRVFRRLGAFAKPRLWFDFCYSLSGSVQLLQAAFVVVCFLRRLTGRFLVAGHVRQGGVIFLVA